MSWLSLCSARITEVDLSGTTYNPGSHRCLADTVKGPGYDKPGVVLVAARCSPTQGEGWFKP